MPMGRPPATPAASAAATTKSASSSARLAPTALARVANPPSAETITPAPDAQHDAEVAAELAALRPVAPARSATDPVLAIAPSRSAGVPAPLDGGSAEAGANSESTVPTTAAGASATSLTSDPASGGTAASATAAPSVAETGERRSDHPGDRDDDDLAAVTRSPLASALALVTGSRRNLAIAGGAALLLVVVVAMAASAGGKKKLSLARGPAVGEPARPPAPQPARPSEALAAAHAGSDAADVDTPAASGDPLATEERDDVDGRDGREPHASAESTVATRPDPANQTTRPAKTSTAKTATAKSTTTKTATASRTTAARTTTARATEPAAAPVRANAQPARVATLGGKPVVLEYDEQAKDLGRVVPGASRDDQIAIQRARAAYVTGTQRLRSGDGGGAITYFKQSLAHYPGYVAGYRGLGLAYDKQGDAAKAAQALRTYVGAAPGARDASPLRTRIATLSSQSK
jgi:hypothetical protein